MNREGVLKERYELILSVSRRTDIPAFYADWFFNRLREGYVLIRNPVNYRQVSRVNLSPCVIDCIVFWTKDPAKILERLELLAEYQYYFLITVNAYGDKIERNLPAKESLIEAFKRLSMKIGKEKTIWRYDPILLTKEIDLSYHEKNFSFLASELAGYTDRCLISFVDFYRKTARKMKYLNAAVIDQAKMLEIAAMLSKNAYNYNLKVELCSEAVDLSVAGIGHGKCIDDRLISKITGREIKYKKDRNQRAQCGCIESIDIGAYNTCEHGCLYCYANDSDQTVLNNLRKHNPNAPLLIGDLEPGDKITDRL